MAQFLGGVALCDTHQQAVRDAIEAEQRAAGPIVEPAVTFAGIVYYITFDGGETVKIGTTTDPRQRFLALSQNGARSMALLAAKPGHYKEERAVHRRYKHLALGGEMFRVTDELLLHVLKVREENPDWHLLPDRLDLRQAVDVLVEGSRPLPWVVKPPGSRRGTAQTQSKPPPQILRG